MLHFFFCLLIFFTGSVAGICLFVTLCVFSVTFVTNSVVVNLFLYTELPTLAYEPSVKEILSKDSFHFEIDAGISVLVRNDNCNTTVTCYSRDHPDMTVMVDWA